VTRRAYRDHTPAGRAARTRITEKRLAVDAITNDFGQVLLWSFWFFIWIAALMSWIGAEIDLIARHQSGFDT